MMKQEKLEKTSTKKSKTERFRAVFSVFFLPSSHFDKTLGHFLSFFSPNSHFFCKKPTHLRSVDHKGIHFFAIFFYMRRVYS